jgi:uncharacterized repeat protein (TIGR01451 family)
MSRGTIYTLGTGVRRGFALFWTALLLAALLSQYVAVLSPAKTIAANSGGTKVMGGFEIDGDFPAGGSTDWANSANTGAGLVSGPTVQDPMSSDPSVLAGGNSDADPVSGWRYTNAQAPQKADIGNLYAVNRVFGGDQWAYIGVERQSGSGTVQYDLEFNKLGDTTNGHGVTVPNRSVGDLLFTATVQGGGVWTIPAVVSHWTGTSWSSAQAISSSLFYGLANQFDALHPTSWPDELGSTVPSNQFAEMAMNVSEIASGFIGCPGYGTLNIRSISSTGDTPELKDVVAPIPLDLSTCGSLTWQKQDDAGNALGGATFTITPNPWTGTDSAPIADLTSGSPANGRADQDNRDGFFKLIDVIPGTYSVQETGAPAGYLLDPAAKSVTISDYENAKLTYIFSDPVHPAIAITKAADAAKVSAGDPIGFTIKVSDIAGNAKGVKLSDPLPAGVTWAVDGGTGAADCVSPIAGGTLSCDFGDMAKGDSFTVHLSAATSAAACSTYDNTATASASNADSVRDSASIACLQPGLSISKTADEATVSAGDPAGFTMVVTNMGAGKAYDVTLSDPLPANVAWSTTNSACVIKANVLTCSWDSLNAGASVSVKVSGETTAAACGTLNNTVTVAATNEPSANLGNNQSSASITVVCPPVSITKTADAASVSAGDPIGFTIAVSNNSDFTALNVTVDDPLPTNGGLGWTIDGPANGFSIAGGHLTHAATTMAANTSLSVHIVSGTTAATCGLVDNTASLTFNGGTEKDSSTVRVDCPDVTITKTAAKSPILAGQTASYTITVTNLGPGTAYGVTVNDPLPAGAGWAVINAKCSIAGGSVLCTVGTLAEGATFSVTLLGPTTTEQCGQLPNTDRKSVV